MVRNVIRYIAVLGVAGALLFSAGCRKKKYENPITKDTQQPDKVLFDTAIDDIEHGRYERARLTLQTLMNTYDTSEYLAKAKLALADSWYREGGAHGFAQAEAEYKDFILFYQNMEEAAEAQSKICKMEYQQMDKSDRDPLHAFRAQDECKQVVLQFPNSKFAPEAMQYLRNVQEVLADEEYKVGVFYGKKGSFPANANRLQALTDQYPLYSNAGDALWLEGEAYHHMGDNFETQEAAAYSKLVAHYPLNSHVTEATAKLKAMGRPVPETDPVDYARAKHDQDNRVGRSFLSKAWGPFSGHPDSSVAAKSGNPNMNGFRPTVAASVPNYAAGPAGTSAGPTGGVLDSNVTGTIVNNSTLIDKAPNELPGGANTNPAGAAPAAGTTPAAGGTAAVPAVAPPVVVPNDPNAPKVANPNAPLPMNHTGNIKPRTPQQQLKDAARAQEAQKKAMSKAQKMQDEAQRKKQQDDAKAAKKKKDQPKDQQKGPDSQTQNPAPATVKQ